MYFYRACSIPRDASGGRKSSRDSDPLPGTVPSQPWEVGSECSSALLIAEEGDQRTRWEFSRLLELAQGAGLFRSERGFGAADWRDVDGFYASLGFEHAFFDVRVTRDPGQADANLIAVSGAARTTPGASAARGRDPPVGNAPRPVAGDNGAPESHWYLGQLALLSYLSRDYSFLTVFKF